MKLLCAPPKLEMQYLYVGSCCAFDRPEHGLQSLADTVLMQRRALQAMHLSRLVLCQVVGLWLQN